MLALARDVFHGQDYAPAWNLPESDEVTVGIWDGDPEAAGSERDSLRVSTPWLQSTQPAPEDVRTDNPAVITMGPAPSGGWSITHVKVQCGPVGSEVDLWISPVSGGTLSVPEGHYVSIPASAVLSVMTWAQGDSGTGEATHVKPASVVLTHCLGGIGEIREDTTFTLELWAHDPLHTAHGSPLTSWAVDRTDAVWTLAAGPPVTVKNTAALTSPDVAPVGGWAWDYTTLRVTGGTAFLFKSSTPSTGTVAEGDAAEIAAEAILFELEAV
jgi:hypothetical protein